VVVFCNSVTVVSSGAPNEELRSDLSETVAIYFFNFSFSLYIKAILLIFSVSAVTKTVGKFLIFVTVVDRGDLSFGCNQSVTFLVFDFKLMQDFWPQHLTINALFLYRFLFLFDEPLKF